MRCLRTAFTRLAFCLAASLSTYANVSPFTAAVAAESGKVWDESLQELSGVWTTDTGSQIKLLFREDVSASSDALFETLIIPVAVNGGDVTYRSVTANLSFLESVRNVERVLKEKGAPLPESLATIRRNWNLTRTTFNITLISAGGAPTQYGFVRELQPNEVSQLAAVKAKVDDLLQQQAVLIQKESQSKAASDARQQSMLDSPAVKAAAERIGVDQAFFSSSPAQQEQTLAGAKAALTQRVNDAKAELGQIARRSAVSDASAEAGKKRQKLLQDGLAEWEPQLAAVDVVLSALKGTLAAQSPVTPTNWQQYVGRAPTELINSSPLGPTLETLLGGQYQRFARGFEKSEGIALLGEEFVVGGGCMLNGCGSNGSFLIFNAKTQDMTVVMAENGSAKLLSGADLVVPPEAAAMFEKWQNRFNPHPARRIKLNSGR